MIYGLLLILFIIYMPKGILGTLLERREKKRGTPSAGAQAAARSRVESGAST
jgi:branched-chain amino acid transport system permease protein